MAFRTGGLGRFVSELGRRKVAQVTIAYAAVAWLLMQVVDLALDAFDAPDWVMQSLLILVLLGLPIVVALSWIFDMTPGGVIRTGRRERSGDVHDTLSVVLTLSPAEDATLDRTFRSTAKMHCERFGAQATESNPERLIAQFDNAHEALHCAVYLQSRLGHRLPCRASLVIGEAGRHGKLLIGDAVDDALELLNYAQPGGLVVTGAFYDTILDRSGSPYRGHMQETTELLNGHPMKIYRVDRQQISEPAVQAWQHSAAAEPRSQGPWFRIIALALLAAIGLAVWRWLPEVELPGLARVQPSIAVLPFTDVSENEDNQWFVAGLGEEVLTTIAGISGFRVISGRTTLDYQRSGKEFSEIGNELGVSHLLEGSVNRSGNHIRIYMRLNSTEDGSIMWAQNYDASPEDLISVSRDVAQRMAASLQVALSEAEATRLEHLPAVSAEAYTAYLEAIGYLRQPPSTETLDKARSRLSEVVASEPGFHEALAALCETNLQRYNLTQDTDYFNLAQQQCGTVLQSNQENVSAMMALGQLYIAKGEPATAETYYRRGLSLDQYNVELRAGLAKSLRTQGDRAGAEAMLQEAIRIDPRNWGLYSDLGQLYLSWGKSSEAVAAYDKAFELVPDNASVLGNVGSAYYYLGEFRKAALAYERSLEFDPTASAYSNIATLWFYEGEFERARENYEKAAEMTPRDYRVWSNLADAESQIDGMQESAQSHYREAFGMADELLAINQTNNEALVVSAWCAANLGMDEQARERVERAQSIAPDDYNVSYVSATVYAVLGAQEALQSAVQRSIELGFPQQILLATPILEGKLGFLEDET